mgnify:CR=1 FL=1
MIGLTIPMDGPILRTPEKAWKTIFVPEPRRTLAHLLASVPPAQLERALRILGLDRAILAPLVAREGLIGLLVLWSPNLRDDDVPAATAFASQMAVVIENARLLRELSEQSERLRAFAARLAEEQHAGAWRWRPHPVPRSRTT